MMEKSIKIEKEFANNVPDEDDDIFLELWESTDFSNFNPSEEDEKNEKIISIKKEKDIPKIKIEPPNFEKNDTTTKINLKSRDKNSSKQTAADALLSQKRTRSEILSRAEINDDIDDQETKGSIIYFFDGRSPSRYKQSFFI